jgi:hypothetical protein
MRELQNRELGRLVERTELKEAESMSGRVICLHVLPIELRSNSRGIAKYIQIAGELIERARHRVYIYFGVAHSHKYDI